MDCVKLCTRNVVNTVLALFNQILNLVEARLSGIANIFRALRAETHVINCKDNRVEKGLIEVVEGTVDKYVLSELFRTTSVTHEATLGNGRRDLFDACYLWADPRSAWVIALPIVSRFAVRGGAVG